MGAVLEAKAVTFRSMRLIFPWYRVALHPSTSIRMGVYANASSRARSFLQRLRCFTNCKSKLQGQGPCPLLSGCGKYTLLNMIADLEVSTSGESCVGGIVVNGVHPPKRDIAIVF